MREKQRVIGAAGGALGLSAFAAALGACCVAPWAVALLGVTGAIALVRLAFLQPYLLAGALVLLVLAFWSAYRRSAEGSDATCAPSRRRSLRWIAWIAAALVAGLSAMSLIPTIAAYL